MERTAARTIRGDWSFAGLNHQPTFFGDHTVPNNYNRDNRGGYGGGYRGGPRRSGPPQRRGIPLSALDPNLTAASHKVIGCATEIHTALGPGYEESVYVEALKNELAAQGISFKEKHAFEVKYKDKVVGKTVVDLFIEDKFILDVSTTHGEIGGGERAVLRAQLKAADLMLGLVMSFGGRRLKDGLVRVLNVEKFKAEHGGEFGEEDWSEGDHGGEHHEEGHDRTVDFDERPQ